jgi:hypothetical protein
MQVEKMGYKVAMDEMDLMVKIYIINFQDQMAEMDVMLLNILMVPMGKMEQMESKIINNTI